MCGLIDLLNYLFIVGKAVTIAAATTTAPTTSITEPTTTATLTTTALASTIAAQGKSILNYQLVLGREHSRNISRKLEHLT